MLINTVCVIHSRGISINQSSAIIDLTCWFFCFFSMIAKYLLSKINNKTKLPLKRNYHQPGCCCASMAEILDKKRKAKKRAKTIVNSLCMLCWWWYVDHQNVRIFFRIHVCLNVRNGWITTTNYSPSTSIRNPVMVLCWWKTFFFLLYKIYL